MNDPHRMSDIPDARARAAQVRRRWSPTERNRRKGLPPDTPWSLLRKLLAPQSAATQVGFNRPVRQWCQATANG